MQNTALIIMSLQYMGSHLGRPETVLVGGDFSVFVHQHLYE